MNWSEIMNNLGVSLKDQGAQSLSSVTEAWDAFKNIDSLSIPTINGKALFGSVAQMTSTFSNAGTGDTTQTNLLSGLTDIWTNGNNALKDITGNENTGTTKYVINDEVVKGGKQYGDPNEISEEEYNSWNERGENGKYMQSRYHKVTTPSDYTPVTNFQNFSDNEQFFEVVDTSDSDRLNFQTPDWSYADFINERAIFQKSLQNPLGEQGWFYFKIFFNFDTQYGLFGGLLNDPDPMMATNSAYKYLRACEALGKYYKTNDRQVALMKFAKILSYISTYAPWFFKGIKNLNQANIPVINDFTKEKSIEIECSNDAIDMRLNTLMDLYKFACYDEIDQKEIVPDNLRKFDMTVMVFHAPIKYFHTSFRTKGGHKYDYKGTSVNNNTGFSDTMSFKMFTFINCEIDKESLGNMIPGSMNNEKPFNIGGGSIKIFYDRVYTHTMNEFMHIMFGNDGLYYDGSASTDQLQGVNAAAYNMQTMLQRQRIKDIKDVYNDTPVANSNSSSVYKSVVDASEELCINNMRALGFNSLGNFSATNKDLQFDDPNDRTKLSDYYDLKLKMLKNDPGVLGEALSNVSSGSNEMITELIETYNKTLSTINASWTKSDKTLPVKTVNNHGGMIATDRNETSAILYWENKINAMKDGYVSPETLIQRYEGQVYNYDNFTKSGYGDKTINLTKKGKMTDGNGTNYWNRKIEAMMDGIASPETLEQRYEDQVYETGNKFGNYAGNGQSARTLRTDNNGVPIPGEGTNYWLEKFRALKYGVIEKNAPIVNVENDNSNSGLNDKYAAQRENKLNELKDGTIEKKEPTIKVTHDGTIPNVGDPNFTKFNNKLEQLKNGVIEKNEPANNELQTKLDDLFNGTIDKKTPEINLDKHNKSDEFTHGLNDPYSGEYFDRKLEQMNDGKVEPENIVQNTVFQNNLNNINNP